MIYKEITLTRATTEKEINISIDKIVCYYTIENGKGRVEMSHGISHTVLEPREKIEELIRRSMKYLPLP